MPKLLMSRSCYGGRERHLPQKFQNLASGNLVKVLVTQSCPTLCNPLDCSQASLSMGSPGNLSPWVWGKAWESRQPAESYDWAILENVDLDQGF